MLTFEGEHFEVVTIHPARMFGAEVVWFDNERARIFDRERAVLDLFMRVREFGGIATALEILEAHRSKVRINHLIAHALALDVASVAKRLGWSLERLGVGRRQLRALLDVRASTYNLLDPSRPATGKREARWQIRNNLEVAA
jgi:predicted transcriptional regulator of viral defense system